MVSRPLTKSIKAMRLFISEASGVSLYNRVLYTGSQRQLTSIDLRLLHVLPRQGVRLDDFGQRSCLEVPLARLFLRAVLSRVLLHALQVVGPPSELVLPLFEELAGLLAHLDHPIRRVTEHLDDPCNLVVLG